MQDTFHTDLDYANHTRARLDTHFYPLVAHEGRFVPLGRSEGSLHIQREVHIDCIAAARCGGSVTIEEKIVRWPGYPYTAMTVETHSNLERTGHDVIGDGWIAVSRADYLLYAFEQPDKTLRIWMFFLPKLRAWFWPRVETFKTADTSNRLYTTRCRIVPLRDIPKTCVKFGDHHV